MELPNWPWGLITAVLLSVGALVWVFSALEIKIKPEFRAQAFIFLGGLIAGVGWMMYELKIFIDWRDLLVVAAVVFIYGVSRTLDLPSLTEPQPAERTSST